MILDEFDRRDKKKMSEKIKVTVEEIERVAVRRIKRVSSFCAFCERETEMISPDEIALIYQIGGIELISLIGSGAVHFSETVEGFLLICAASLDDRITNSTTQTRHEIAF